MTVGRILGMLILLSSAPALAQQVIGEPRLLDGFEDATPWRVVTSNQVSGELRVADGADGKALCLDYRSEEHTSELQSLMRISYAVFCLKKKPNTYKNNSID